MDNKNVDKNLCLQWMSEILKKTQDNIFVYSIDWICLYTNDHLANILWFDPVGKHLREIFSHRSEEFVQKVLTSYKKIRDEQKWDVIPVQKEKVATGEERFFSVTREPIVWNGHPSIAGIGKDITDLFLAKQEVEKANEEVQTTNEELVTINEELQKTNDTLEQTNQKLEEKRAQLNQFTRHILHDIKNPTASILWFSDIINRYIDDLSKNEEIDQEKIKKLTLFINSIKSSWEKIQWFIEDLSQYDKLKKWDIEIKKESFDTKNFFQKIYGQQYWYITYINQLSKKQKVAPKDITLVLEESIKELPLSLVGDKDLLERIFSNFISNAIKFTEKWTVSIWAEQDDSVIRFSIKDTWKGIAEEDFGRVFQEFQSGFNYQPVIKWSGLGLSIVSKIIHMLWGRILPIQSEVGKWTTFSFELPFDS